MISIDLGSNSLRIIQRECEKNTFVNSYEKIVKTAELLHSDGIVSVGALQRILQGFKEAAEIFDFKNEPYVAVTTETMRRASNASEVLESIYRETGLRFEIISPEKEAELALLGVERRLESLGFAGSFLLVDIGGGSTEIIFKKAHLCESKSFPVGIVTMASKYPSKELMQKNLPQELAAIKEYVEDYRLREGKSDFYVATAGTPTTIAAFKQGMRYVNYDTKRINGSTLNYFDCMQALRELLELDFDERARYVGVGREELIVAGVMIYASLFEIVDHEACVIIDDGLREGAAIKACEKGIKAF